MAIPAIPKTMVARGWSHMFLSLNRLPRQTIEGRYDATSPTCRTRRVHVASRDSRESQKELLTVPSLPLSETVPERGLPMYMVLVISVFEHVKGSIGRIA